MLEKDAGKISVLLYFFLSTYTYVTPVGVCFGQAKNLKFLSPH